MFTRFRNAEPFLTFAFTIAVALGASSCRQHRDAPSPVEPIESRPRSIATSDGALIEADEYGRGERVVILVHGGRFNKESWRPQAQSLAESGWRVLAINLRGYGNSRAGAAGDDRYDLDVLAAVRFAREEGGRAASILGGSMGATAAAEAACIADAGEIDRMVLLAPGVVDEPERIKGRKLYIIARDDPNAAGKPRLIRLREQYQRAPEPKRLLVLEGTAHAQFLFETDEGPRVMAEIVRFLSSP